MNAICRIVLLLVAFPSAVVAQPTSREDLIGKITHMYFEGSVFSGDSPVVDNLIVPARTANPRATEQQWKDVKAAVVPALANAMIGTGSPFDDITRAALRSMSDEELRRLLGLLEDPLYERFNKAISSPEAQAAMMRAMTLLGLQIGEILNSALRQQGLNEVH